MRQSPANQVDSLQLSLLYMMIVVGMFWSIF